MAKTKENVVGETISTEPAIETHVEPEPVVIESPIAPIQKRRNIDQE